MAPAREAALEGAMPEVPKGQGLGGLARWASSPIQPPVIFRMMTNPDPNQSFIFFLRKSPILNTNPRGPEYAGLLQSNGGMSWVYLHDHEVFVCELFNSKLREQRR